MNRYQDGILLFIIDIAADHRSKAAQPWLQYRQRLKRIFQYGYSPRVAVLITNKHTSNISSTKGQYKKCFAANYTDFDEQVAKEQEELLEKKRYVHCILNDTYLLPIIVFDA